MGVGAISNFAMQAKSAASQAVDKIFVPRLKVALNKASLKILEEASKAGDAIAADIVKSIKSGELFQHISEHFKASDLAYDTHPIPGRDSNNQRIDHKPIVQFEKQGEGVNLAGIYMQGKNPGEKPQPWNPSSQTGTTPPPSPSTTPQGQPGADTSQLPHRPPPGAGLNSMFQRLSQQQPSSQKARTQMPPQPAPKDTAPHSSENVHRDLEPDLGLPKEAAPEQPRQSAKPAKAEIRHALKVIREARQDRRKRIRKRRERKLARRAEKHEIALNGLKLHEERRIDTQNLLNEIRAKQQESNKKFMEDTAKNSTGFNY
ncbi:MULTISPECIES: hypothetical protein [Pseudomonas]|uniref:Uncharacterized protein n=1 Tax=Pseudomonas quercus TaxID=2722792 RepID=A0ABX0YHB0_9PSED|nr:MULTISPECIES: hypothetical protein [Pseudomonas]MBF7144278.1 hypothetical protein [Pseudomonas sp. LY10J]NJP02818.1 hypothetical protein [Pseudomonas quercus]